jgi:hypothetical protein
MAHGLRALAGLAGCLGMAACGLTQHGAPDGGEAHHASPLRDASALEGGAAAADADVDDAACDVAPEPMPRCAELPRMPAIGAACDQPGLVCHDTWLVGGDACNQRSASTSCCDGFWWGDYTFSDNPPCPALASGQDLRCPGPLVEAGPCPEQGLLCRYEHIEPRICCDGAWRTAECDGDAGACECPTPTSLGLRSCADVDPSWVLTCELGGCQDGGFVTLAVSDEPLPEPTGGAIEPGLYVLTELVLHEPERGCLEVFGVELAATLWLGPGGRAFLAQSRGPGGTSTTASSFTYEPSGSALGHQSLCEQVSLHETLRDADLDRYSATAESIVLLSTRCGYRTMFERIGD